MQDDLAEQVSRRTVLAGEEVDRRKVVLIRLQDALAVLGFESVLVGRHALTLRSHGRGQLSDPGQATLSCTSLVRADTASSRQMAGNTVSETAVPIPQTTRAERPDSSCPPR